MRSSLTAKTKAFRCRFSRKSFAKSPTTARIQTVLARERRESSVAQFPYCPAAAPCAMNETPPKNGSAHFEKVRRPHYSRHIPVCVPYAETPHLKSGSVCVIINKIPTRISAGDFTMIVTRPPLGWNTWNTFGANISEELIMQSADAMVREGLL